MSQIADQPRSELLSYNKMKTMYKDKGNEKMVKKLDSYKTNNPDKSWLKRWFAASERDTAMHELGGGTMYNMKSVITGIFFPILRCRDYTRLERINIWKGESFVQKTQISYDRMEFVAKDSVPELKIPIYFLAGKHDLTCCYDIQKEYYNDIKAPLKGFYTFKNSAHSPLFEEPKEVMNVLKKDVLNGTASMSD